MFQAALSAIECLRSIRLKCAPCTHGPGVCCVPDIQHHLLCSPALVNGQHLQEAAEDMVAQSTREVASQRQAQPRHCRNTLCLATSNMNMHMECDSTASACMWFARYGIC